MNLEIVEMKMYALSGWNEAGNFEEIYQCFDNWHAAKACAEILFAEVFRVRFIGECDE